MPKKGSEKTTLQEKGKDKGKVSRGKIKKTIKTTQPTLAPDLFPVPATTPSTPARAPRRTYVTKSKDEVFIANTLKLKTQLEKNNVQFALALAEIYRNRLYRSIGRTNFVEFAEQDLGWSFRKAYGYVGVGLTIEEYAIDIEKAQRLSSSKLELIASMSRIKGITEKHIEAAVENALEARTFSDFYEWADMVRGKLLPSDESQNGSALPARQVTVKFRLPASEVDFMTRLFASAKESIAKARQVEIDTLPNEMVLHAILQEWAEFKGIELNLSPDEPIIPQLTGELPEHVQQKKATPTGKERAKTNPVH